MKHFFLFLVLTGLCWSCSNDDTPESGGSIDPNNTNANPSVILNAQNLEIPRLDSNTGTVLSHYVSYNGRQVLNYTVDWNVEKRHSRWVAFTFTSTTAGTAWSRDQWKNTEWGKDPFQPDPDLPIGQRTELEDYYRSGYDRGHLCASADRLFSKDANEQTFYLSNMSPQDNSFNSDDWGKLETQVRNWGRNNSFRDTLYVVKGGTILPSQLKATTTSGMPVPKYYFMAVLCKKFSGGQNTYKAIGFWVEHKSYGGNPNLRSWACTIDELEERTGIDFFCNLPDRVENAVESTYNFGEWSGL